MLTVPSKAGSPDAGAEEVASGQALVGSLGLRLSYIDGPLSSLPITTTFALLRPRSPSHPLIPED